jgi:prepilin-type N-terminal cleavage/methylation domain-containing protein
MKKKGYTLIELLVVIAIIALLLAILMPSLSKVKMLAKTLQCATNVRTLALASYTYASDNNDNFCGSWNYNNNNSFGVTWGGESDWAWSPWQIGTNTAVSYTNGSPFIVTLEERHEGIKRGSLFPYIENVDAYHCVSDKSFGKNFRSYSMPNSLNSPQGSNFQVVLAYIIQEYIL